MAEQHPERTLGVVTFERSVSIIGDGVEKPQNVNVDFNNFEALMENGRVEAQTRMRNPIRQTKNNLLQKVQDIRTAGQTALGPGVVTAVAMAAKGGPGS